MTHIPRRQNGPRIRLLREQRGMKTGELARRVEVARPTLTTYENGSRQASWELLHRIAAALDVSLLELLSDKGRAEYAAMNAQIRASA